MQEQTKKVSHQSYYEATCPILSCMPDGCLCMQNVPDTHPIPILFHAKQKRFTHYIGPRKEDRHFTNKKMVTHALGGKFNGVGLPCARSACNKTNPTK